MRKKLLCCILISALTFQFCGCGKTNTESTENNGMAGAEDIGTTAENGSSGGEDSDPTGEDLFLSLTDLPWRDNSLDAYSAVVNMPLRYTGYSQQQYAMGLNIGEFFWGNTGASVYKYHYSEEEADEWSEIKAITDQGVETSFLVAIVEKQSSYGKIGSIAGSDHYMMMTVKGAEDTDTDQDFLYRVYETDEDMLIEHLENRIGLYLLEQK